MRNELFLKNLEDKKKRAFEEDQEKQQKQKEKQILIREQLKAHNLLVIEQRKANQK